MHDDGVDRVAQDSGHTSANRFIETYSHGIIASFFETGHPRNGQLTSIKPEYPLTSNT